MQPSITTALGAVNKPSSREPKMPTKHEDLLELGSLKVRVRPEVHVQSSFFTTEWSLNKTCVSVEEPHQKKLHKIHVGNLGDGSGGEGFGLLVNNELTWSWRCFVPSSQATGAQH